MDVNELIRNYGDDLSAALKEIDSIKRNQLVLDAHSEFIQELNKMIPDDGSNEAPVVDMGTFKFTESRYVRGKRGWMASSLYKKVEEDGLKPFEVPLASIDLTPMHFKVDSTDSFIWHMKRCMNADTDIPILLDDMGQVADGNHRICKAILDGKRYIKAYRMKDMPPYDFNEDSEG